MHSPYFRFPPISENNSNSVEIVPNFIFSHHPSEALMHSPYFRFPPISENNSNSVEIVPNFIFSHHFFDIHPLKFSNDLF